MIISAYCHIRAIDNTIPDDVLNFMKDAAIEKLRSNPALRQVISSVCECKVCGKPFGDRLRLYQHYDEVHNNGTNE